MFVRFAICDILHWLSGRHQCDVSPDNRIISVLPDRDGCLVDSSLEKKLMLLMDSPPASLDLVALVVHFHFHPYIHKRLHVDSMYSS